MYYKNCETYLNEEYIRPIKYMLDHNVSDWHVLDWVGALCNKYLELNAAALAYEKYIKNDLGVDLDRAGDAYKKFFSYMGEHPLYVDFSSLEKVCEDGELVYRVGVISDSNNDSKKSGYRVCIDSGDNNIGSVLGSLRRANSLSQKDLASAVGISAVYLSMIEHNRAGSVGFDIVRSVLDKLGYDIVIKKR